ncbi:MAG: acetylgalactosaminidase, partial [Bacteroidales bacterium]|nr:acetylgalactosaminidase [Bacteroidales bacterium]
MKNRFSNLSVLAIIVIAFMYSSCRPGTNKNSEAPLTAQELFVTPARQAGQTDVIELRCEPIDTVRIAIIGLGMRGYEAVRRLHFIEGVRIVALCDVVPANVEKSQQLIQESGKPLAVGYTG